MENQNPSKENNSRKQVNKSQLDSSGKSEPASVGKQDSNTFCLLYTSPSPRD